MKPQIKSVCVVGLIVIASYSLYLALEKLDNLLVRAYDVPLYSDVLRTDKEGIWKWRLPKERLLCKHQELRLSLVLVRSESTWNLNKADTELRLRISVRGVDENGLVSDRLIVSSIYPTNEPFSEDGRFLWEAYGLAEIEWGLGGVWVEEPEDLSVEVLLLNPAPDLAKGQPRLKLEKPFDHAERAFFKGAIKHGKMAVYLVCLSLAFGLIYFWWKRGRDSGDSGTSEVRR